MNITIKKDQVNFTELVKTSNPETSLHFQSRMVQELSNEFDTEEQKWFVANLYMYLNYHQTDEYPVILDHVWKLIGFSTKGNSKKKLVNNFTEGEDYKVLLIQMDKQVHGGHNEEKVMMNVDTFKNLCLMSATKQSKQIRKYYIKLENVYNKVVNQDYQTYQKELELKDNEIKAIKDSVDYEKRLEKHNVLVDILRDKKCIYLKEMRSLDGDLIIKIGSSEDIESRNISLKSKFGGDDLFCDVFECGDSFRDIEKSILTNINIIENKYKGRLESGHRSIEVVKLTREFNYEQLVDIVKKSLHCRILTSREWIKNKCLEIEKHKLDVISKAIDNGYDLKLLQEILEPKDIEINDLETKKVIDVFKNKNFGRQIQKIDPNNLQKL